MNAYNNQPKQQQTVCRKLRLRMGYSIREMAEDLDIKPATFQRYDEGSAKTPDHVIAAMRETEKKDREFLKRYKKSGTYEQELNQQYPFGIISEGA